MDITFLIAELIEERRVFPGKCTMLPFLKSLVDVFVFNTLREKKLSSYLQIKVLRMVTILLK